jgi:hypothetical protein
MEIKRHNLPDEKQVIAFEESPDMQLVDEELNREELRIKLEINKSKSSELLNPSTNADFNDESQRSKTHFGSNSQLNRI